MTETPAAPLNALDYERIGDAALAAADSGLAGYVSGGAGEERTLKANRDAFDRWALCPRAMRGVEQVDLGAEILGARLSMPVLAAPLAYLGMAAERGEVATARAVGALGTAMCVSSFTTAPLADLAAAGEGPAPWFQLYPLRDRGATRALAEQAAAAGAGALVLTVDAPRLGRRERDLRSGFTIPREVSLPMLEAALSRHHEMSPKALFELVDAGADWSRVEELAELTALPLVVKGVLAGADASAACDHGAAAVVVSNHGGRQLDGARASLAALPEVVDGLGGRAAVLLDGGVRRAADVVKALALGADAVLLGRPVFWALAARGEAGVAHLLSLLRNELELALALLGCASLGELGLEHLRPALPGPG
ncbi:MAG TPA: alpha-hydroxy acid oxidase [Solirubrobacterales bacterium]|nr:alpha-hydroxy acid oxidase [Solirubrobacterales bacterium]